MLSFILKMANVIFQKIKELLLRDRKPKPKPVQAQQMPQYPQQQAQQLPQQVQYGPQQMPYEQPIPIQSNAQEEYYYDTDLMTSRKVLKRRPRAENWIKAQADRR